MKIKIVFKQLIVLLMLNSCAPTQFDYVKPNAQHLAKINQVMVMVEYLNLKQGFDNYWDFDENMHLQKQDELSELTRQILLEKGYVVADKSLKTSGLITARDFLVEHVLDDKKQPQLLTPPYIIRSVELLAENIPAYELLLAELNRPMSAVLADMRSYVKNNYKAQTDGLDLPVQSAILILQVWQSRQIMPVNIGFSVSSSQWDSQVAMASRQANSSTVAYLIDTDSGDVLWSNRFNSINAKNADKFFAKLPSN